MSPPKDPAQKVEIRDAAGRIVGYFVPAPEYIARSVNGQPFLSETGDQPDWQRRCQDLTVERDKLRKDVADLQAEMDQYKQSL